MPEALSKEGNVINFNQNRLLKNRKKSNNLSFQTVIDGVKQIKQMQESDLASQNLNNL